MQTERTSAASGSKWLYLPLILLPAVLLGAMGAGLASRMGWYLDGDNVLWLAYVGLRTGVGPGVVIVGIGFAWLVAQQPVVRRAAGAIFLLLVLGTAAVGYWLGQAADF